MKVLVSGASGLVGSALIPALRAEGHGVGRLVRAAVAAAPIAALAGGDAGDVAWDILAERIDEARLEGWDAIVHLAGANIASERWTEPVKERIRRSRIEGSRLLAQAIAKIERPPRVLVQASAIGFYGDRGDEVLIEDSAPGQGFLPAVCVAWEDAAGPAAARGVRVVFLRFGVILAARGGALAKMLPAFRMGVAGRIGDGRQFMPWLALDDAVGVIRHVIATDALRGPVNAVAPQAVSNLEFTKTLGRVLGRPTMLPLPAFAARLVLGEMADALLLASARVTPACLQASGYRFRHPELEPALRDLLAAR
jgi:uncharacterized protein (TIGR01777 family)